MNVLIFAAGGWISFMNQARGLQSALTSIGVDSELLFSGKNPADTGHIPDLSKYREHAIIAVGSWQDYDRLIAPALAADCRVLPWLVSDAEVTPEGAEKLNALPQILTPSQYCRDIFIRDGVHADKISILYEAIDEDEWRPGGTGQQNEFLKYLSIDEDNDLVMPLTFNLRKAKRAGVPILLTVGGDATSKGAIETIDALQRLDPSTQWLWIIKTLPYVYSFQCSIEQYDKLGELTSRVKFIVGEFSQQFLVQLMNLCDIYVAPSRGEGFGLPLAEAQMCGKMVITHDGTSTREVIVPGKTGLLAKANQIVTSDGKGSMRADPKSLSEQLHIALTDSGLRSELSGQARQSAISRFGKSAIAKQCMEYLNNIVT